MAKSITIKESDIEAARDYMPIATKEQMARLLTTLCVEEVPNPASSKVQPLPNLVRENRRMRQQCLYGVFVQYYLNMSEELQELEYIDRDGEKKTQKANYCLSADAADRWAGSHVFNQMERLKRAKGKVSEKVYDIMYDYKTFENIFLGSISDEVRGRNDPALRMVQLMNMQASPEDLRQLVDVVETYKAAWESEEKV